MSHSSVLELVKSWIYKAKWAASGGNAQPWAVEIVSASTHTVEVRVSIDSKYRQHPSPMDVDGLASVMALGCFSFYMEVIAQGDHYCFEDAELVSGSTPWDFAVVLMFTRSEESSRPYGETDLRMRWTDRSPFLRDPLPTRLIQRIEQATSRVAGVHFTWVDSQLPEWIPWLRKLEYLRWCHSPLRDGLFDEISFSGSRNDDSENHKIPLSQLGAGKVDQTFLALLKRFPGLRAILEWGPAHMISRKAVDLPLKNCAAVGVLQVESGSEGQCFEMGRLFQELWVEFNRSQVSFQPIGLPLIALAYWHGDQLKYGATPWKEDLVKSVTQEFAQRFHLDLKRPTLGFRVGFPTQARLQSPRGRIAISLNQELEREAPGQRISG